MAITRETLRLQRALDAAVQRLDDETTRVLVQAWADAWDEVSDDLTDTLAAMIAEGDGVTVAQLTRSTRLQRALAFILQALEDLASTSVERAAADVVIAVQAAGAGQAAVIASQLPTQAMIDAAQGTANAAVDVVDIDAWSRVDKRQVDAIVRRTTEQITARHYPIAPETYEVVRRELIRGVASGDNPRVVARQMVRRAEKRFNGGLSRALNIARTETLDAHRNAARLAEVEEFADVLTSWVWIAVFSPRTCGSCIAQHGSEHPLSTPGPLDHQQGRCARLPKVKPWADLGYDIEEPETVLADAEEWFDSLPPEEQLELLGPARYSAWASGRFPMSDWSIRKTTDGWRDSYHLAPAPEPLRSVA